MSTNHGLPTYISRIMNTNKTIAIVLVVSLMTSWSCTKEEEFVEPIDAELMEYFERFKEEGLQRGVNVDFAAKQVEGHIEDIQDPHVRGKCLKYTNGDRVVLIDRFMWNSNNDLEKEFLIFHELGHCYLDRGHLNQADEHGYCVSIMHSSNLACENNYYNSTREEYLDELFK